MLPLIIVKNDQVLPSCHYLIRSEPVCYLLLPVVTYCNLLCCFISLPHLNLNPFECIPMDCNMPIKCFWILKACFPISFTIYNRPTISPLSLDSCIWIVLRFYNGIVIVFESVTGLHKTMRKALSLLLNSLSMYSLNQLFHNKKEYLPSFPHCHFYNANHLKIRYLWN